MDLIDFHSKRVSCKLLKRLQQTQHGQKKLNFLTSTCQALIEVLACLKQSVGGPSACAATPQPIPTMRRNSMLMSHEVKRGVVPTLMLRPYDWTLAICEQFTQELRERIQLILIPGGLLQRCYAAVEFRICFAHLPIHRRYMTGGFAMESATSCHDSKYEIAKGGSETQARMATDDGHIYIYTEHVQSYLCLFYCLTLFRMFRILNMFRIWVYIKILIGGLGSKSVFSC